jgi:hypothetical protein
METSQVGMDVGGLEAAELHVKNLQVPEEGIALRILSSRIAG